MVARMKEQGHAVLDGESIEDGRSGAVNNKQPTLMSALAYTFLGKRLGLTFSKWESSARLQAERNSFGWIWSFTAMWCQVGRKPSCAQAVHWSLELWHESVLDCG
jgi:hypothetical protein